MNEPANFDTNDKHPFNQPEDVRPLVCPTDNTFDNPPYLPLIATMHGVYKFNNEVKKMSDKTLCMVAQQGYDSVRKEPKYNHYDVHNLYGWSQTEPTLK
jgi:hypothetical protein